MSTDPLPSARETRAERQSRKQNRGKKRDEGAPAVEAREPESGRRWIFRSLLVLPALLVTLFAASFAVDVVRLRNIDHDAIDRNLDYYLSSRHPSAFPETPNLREVTASPNNIFLFGASSVVITDGHTFGEYLEKDLAADNGELRVLNFGVSGLDSFYIRYGVGLLLQQATTKPRAIVFYEGHNDYNIAYKRMVNGTDAPYGKLFNAFLRGGYYLTGAEFDWADQTHVFGSARYDFTWYAVYNRPRLLNVLQNAGLFEVDSARFRRNDERILESFKQNMQGIVQTAREAGIPLIVVTPIGNFSARPYGSVDVVDEDYRLGREAADPKMAFDSLRRATNNEIFTGDTRAKSALLDYLRTLHDGKTTFVFDLEKDLAAEGFRFDDASFLDYFHFKDAGHQRVGRYIAEKMRATPALRAALAVKEAPPAGAPAAAAASPFAREADEICTRGIARFDEIQQTPPQSLADAATQTERIVASVEQEMKELSGLTAPAAAREPFRRYLELRGQALQWLREGGQAARRGDAGTYAEAQGKAAADGPERTRLARESGFTICSQPQR
jgi:lysophospholipase L1-like esterase